MTLSDPALNRFGLLGHINHTAAAFANLLEQFVTADAVAGFFGWVFGKTSRAARTRHPRFGGSGPRHGRQFIKEVAGVIVNPKQRLDLPPQFKVARAGLIQICAALIGGELQGCGKHRDFGIRLFVHGNSIIYPLIREIETKRAMNRWI